MPIYLKSRNTEIKEMMDDPDSDYERLTNTFNLFKTINSIISRWEKIYNRFIKPEFSSYSNHTWTLLDVGFGGGDIPLNISKWAKDDGVDLDITAIDPDPRAYAYASKQNVPENITFLNASTTDLLHQNKSFDFVISNHLIHHLIEEEFVRILYEAKCLSRRKVLFNDIERNDIGYLIYNITSRILFNDSSFAIEDGLASIKRSYTYKEMNAIVPDGWIVHRIFPYRLLILFDHD